MADSADSAVGANVLTCELCGQSLGQNDSFGGDRVIPMKWARFDVDPATVKRDVPTGNECFGCQKTRTNTFGRMSIQDLKAAMALSQEVETKFHERRADNLLRKRVQWEQVDVKALTTKSAYADCYEEGSWLPLAAYVQSTGANLAEFDSSQKQADFVRTVCKQEIKYIGGKPGVIVPDFSDGRKRVRIGQNSSTSKTEEHYESFDNAAVCEQIYTAADKANASLMKGNSLEDARRLVSEYHAASEAEPDSRAGSECMEEGPRLSFGLFDESGPLSSAEKAPKKLPNKRPTPSAEMQPSKRAATARQPKDVVASTAAPASTTEEARMQPKEEIGPLTPKHREGADKLTKKHSDLLTKGRTLLQKNKETFSVANMWAGGLRRRSLESAQKALSAITTSLLTMPDTEEGRKLCAEINFWCDSAEDEFDFLQAIKKDPAAYVSPNKIEKANMDLLLKMSVQNLSAILLWVANEFLKGLDFENRAQSSSDKFFAVCACHHDQSLTVGLVFLAASRGDRSFAPQVASNFQQQILGVWYDRLFRSKSVDRFRSLVAMCQIEKVDLFRFASDKPSANDLSLPASGAPGRAFSSLVEMEAQMLRTMCTADWNKASALEYTIAQVAVELKGNLSLRIQTLLRTAGTAKTLWSLVEAASKRAVTPAAVTTEALACVSDIPKHKIEKAVEKKDLKSLLQTDVFLRTDRAIQAVEALRALPQTSEVPAEKMEVLEFAANSTEKLVGLEGVKLLHDICMSLGDGFWTDELSQEVTSFAREPVSRLVSWLMHFKVVSMKLRLALYRVADVLTEMIGCQASMRHADKKLTVDSFVAAVRAMNKLSKSKHPQDLRQAILEMESQSAASEGVDPVLTGVLAAAQQLVRLLALDAKRDRQSAWLKILLRSKKDEVLELDASVKASLDADAGSFLRSVEVIGELAQAETPVGDLDLFSKTGVKELMSRFVQISALGVEELVAAGIENAEGLKTGLFTAVQTVLGSLTEQIKEGKSTMAPLADKYQKILGAVSDWNEETIQSVLDNGNPSEVQRLCTCVKSAQAWQGCIDAILPWEQQFQTAGSSGLKPCFDELVESHNAPPSIRDVALMGACMVGADIVMSIKPTMDANEIAQKVALFYKFATQEVNLLKKDIPSALTTRLDKASKDAKADAKGMPPPSQTPSAKGKGKAKGAAATK